MTEQGQQLPAFISYFPRCYWTNNAPVVPSFRLRPTSLQSIIPASQRTHLHAPQNALKWKYSPSMQPFLDPTPERCLNRLGRRHIRFWIFSRFLFLSIFILFFRPIFAPQPPTNYPPAILYDVVPALAFQTLLALIVIWAFVVFALLQDLQFLPLLCRRPRRYRL